MLLRRIVNAFGTSTTVHMVSSWGHTAAAHHTCSHV